MTTVLQLMLPGHELRRADAKPFERVAEFIARMGWARFAVCGDGRRRWQFRTPTVCVINGKFVLQRAWKRRRIKPDDKICFLSRPMGGGSSGTGKQVLGIVALIAVAAFAFWAGPLAAGAIFGASTGLAAQLFTAGLVASGTVLVNMFAQREPTAVPELRGTSNMTTTLRQPQRGHFRRWLKSEISKLRPRVQQRVSRSSSAL